MNQEQSITNVEVLKEKLLLLKQLGISEEELKYANQMGENLDGVFNEMAEKMQITTELLAKMFAIFFHSEFIKIFKEKQIQLEMMEEHGNDLEMSRTIGWCFGELIVRFCKKNDGIALQRAESFKEAIIFILPVIHKIEKENPLALSSFYAFSTELNKKAGNEEV